MKYREIGYAEMQPDVYGGKNCDEHIPRWKVYMYGDMEPEYDSKLDLLAKVFPPGTKVSIEVPECPECGRCADECEKDCTFDWKDWVEEKYS